MNHRHRKVLHAVFSHPLNHNIDPGHLEAVLGELGAELRPTAGGAVQVTLGGQTHSFHFGRHSVSGEQVLALRRFLEAAGVSPDAYPA